jgi:hypothetical protein
VPADPDQPALPMDVVPSFSVGRLPLPPHPASPRCPRSHQTMRGTLRAAGTNPTLGLETATEALGQTGASRWRRGPLLTGRGGGVRLMPTRPWWAHRQPPQHRRGQHTASKPRPSKAVPELTLNR